jgi:hypothetical protein
MNADTKERPRRPVAKGGGLSRLQSAPFVATITGLGSSCQERATTLYASHPLPT